MLSSFFPSKKAAVCVGAIMLSSRTEAIPGGDAMHSRNRQGYCNEPAASRISCEFMLTPCGSA
jgi:hypothetical protein